MQFGSGIKSYPDRAETKGLIGVINVTFPIFNACRYPPREKLGISFNVRGEVEQLFGTVRE
jgi:hypothetical protein